MPPAKPRRPVVFVGPAAADAAARFNAVAGRMGLPFAADTAAAADAPAFDTAGWAAADIEAKVMDVVAKLLGGGGTAPPPAPPPPKKPAATVYVGRETKGRRGKGVTTVSDVPLHEAGLMDLAATLKAKCGTGGTVKDRVIEIQGDHRDRLVVELEKLGYKVKRRGG